MSIKTSNLVLETVDKVLDDQYTTSNFSPESCGMNNFGNTYPYSKVCRWNTEKNKIFTYLFYKDVEDGEIFLIRVDIIFCNHLKKVKQSNIIFELNNVEKTYILDHGEKASNLSKLNSFLEISVPYQKTWAKQYHGIISGLNKNNMYKYDKKKDRLIYSNGIIDDKPLKKKI